LRAETILGSKKEYLTGIVRAYRAIDSAERPAVILDSSKNPSYALLLQTCADIDLHILHLVRDSRAVAYSRLRRKKRPEIHWKDEFMAITPPRKTALEWNAVNLATELLKRGASSYTFLRYEDFVRSPKSTVSTVLGGLGLDLDGLTFSSDTSIHLKGNHTVSGNPSRFQVGDVQLTLDDEWRRGMNRRDRLLMTCSTAPMLKAYGYI